MGGGLRDVVVIAFAGLFMVEVITGGHSLLSDELLVFSSRKYFLSTVTFESSKRERGGTVSRTSTGPRADGDGPTGAVTAATRVRKIYASVPLGASTG